MSWIHLIPVLLFFGIFLYVIGSVLLLALGSTRLRTYGCAPVFTLALVGLLAFASPPLPWGGGLIGGGLVLALALILAIRCLLGRKSPIVLLKETAKGLRTSWAQEARKPVGAIGLGLVLNLMVVYMLFIAPVPSPEALLQNYDDPFHFSVVRHIIQTGSASPFGAGSVAGDAGALYPDLWHCLVALIASLFGCGITAAVWAVCLGILIFMVPVGVALLVLSLYPRANAGTLVLACVVPSLLPTSIPVFGFSFGILFANYLALATLPFALALLMGCAFFHERPGVRKASLLWLVGVILVDVCAVGLAHPNTVILLVIVAVPFILTRIPVRWGAALVALGAVLWVVLFSSGAFARTVRCLDRVGVSESIGRRFFVLIGIDPSAIAVNEIAIIVVCVLPLVAAVAVAFLARRWAGSWYLVSLGACLSLFAFSAFPLSEAAALLTGFWYRDIFRFMVFVTFLACPLLACVPQAVVEAIGAHLKSVAAMRVAYGVAGLVCIAGCVLFLVRPAPFYPASLKEFNDVTLRIGAPAGFGPEEQAFCEQVAGIVGEGSVLNNADDESVWLYPAFGVDALLKARPANYLTSMDADTQTVIQGIDRIAEASPEGEAVREAAARLDLRYVVKMSDYPIPTVEYDVQGMAAYLSYGAVAGVTEGTEGFSLVAKEGDWELFAIDRDELP